MEVCHLRRGNAFYFTFLSDSRKCYLIYREVIEEEERVLAVSEDEALLFRLDSREYQQGACEGMRMSCGREQRVESEGCSQTQQMKTDSRGMWLHLSVCVCPLQMK